MAGTPSAMQDVRLPDGGLVLHSVVALREDALAELDALGEPRIMLIPHAKHAMGGASC